MILLSGNYELRLKQLRWIAIICGLISVQIAHYATYARSVSLGFGLFMYFFMWNFIKPQYILSQCLAVDVFTGRAVTVIWHWLGRGHMLHCNRKDWTEKYCSLFHKLKVKRVSSKYETCWQRYNASHSRWLSIRYGQFQCKIWKLLGSMKLALRFSRKSFCY